MSDERMYPYQRPVEAYDRAIPSIPCQHGNYMSPPEPSPLPAKELNRRYPSNILEVILRLDRIQVHDDRSEEYDLAPVAQYPMANIVDALRTQRGCTTMCQMRGNPTVNRSNAMNDIPPSPAPLSSSSPPLVQRPDAKPVGYLQRFGGVVDVGLAMELEVSHDGKVVSVNGGADGQAGRRVKKDTRFRLRSYRRKRSAPYSKDSEWRRGGKARRGGSSLDESSRARLGEMPLWNYQEFNAARSRMRLVELTDTAGNGSVLSLRYRRAG